jgi:hypothetical protein
VTALEDSRPPEPVFTVRPLKYGTFEVVLEEDFETPRRHISDFRSKDEAQTWIKENAAAWAKRRLPQQG